MILSDSAVQHGILGPINVRDASTAHKEGKTNLLRSRFSTFLWTPTSFGRTWSIELSATQTRN